MKDRTARRSWRVGYVVGRIAFFGALPALIAAILATCVRY
jgi:hypothetical protein